MKELLLRLLRVPSVSSDIPRLEEVMEIVKEYFALLPQARIETFVVHEKPSLIVKNFDGLHAHIVLNGHLDVVPPSEDGQFEPQERDGKLFARGAIDMKAWIVVIMEVMKTILEEGFLDKKIMLMITCDEEIGGFDGAKYLVEHGYTGDVVLIPDGGSLDEIIYGAKGMYTVEVASKGVSCHSSQPWSGDNALLKPVQCYHALHGELQDTETAYHSDDHRGTTVNLNMLHAGTAGNVIPSESTAKIDIRFTERYSLDEVKGIVQHHAQQHGCEVVKEVTGHVLYTDPAHPTVQRYQQVAQKIAGRAVTLAREHGTSDGRFFAASGSVVLLHRPRGGNLHAKDERVMLEDLETLKTIYLTFIRQ